MTLRTKLLLALVSLLTVGLVTADVVTYTQLRSFLFARIDPQLQVASMLVAHNLEFTNNLLPDRSATRTAASPNGTGSTAHPYGRPSDFGSSRRLSGLAPTGTYGELVEQSGKPYGTVLQSVYGSKPPPAPKLPQPLPSDTSGRGSIFTAQSSGPDKISYRVLVRKISYGNLSAVVAIPLTDVNQTLGRLLLVEVLVSVLALVGLALIAWWVVRRGLRPLADMAGTAATIAGGELGRRVAPADAHTEVGRLGLALNTMLGEIEDAFANRMASEDRLRRFLADASHELRTPLTSIRGYAEIFELGASQRPADLEVSMRHIREEAERMGLLVDDLLLLARLDQERPLRIERVDLVGLVTKSITAARATAPDHPIVLDAPARAEIDADPDRIRQVVDNLLGNALRFSPPAAPVDVRVRIGEDVLIEVADQGPGVAPEEVDRIFEPFHRADPSRTRATGGAGLGLAIVAAIARAHGGTVGVGTNGASGSRFWIRLPPPGPPEPSDVVDRQVPATTP